MSWLRFIGLQALGVSMVLGASEDGTRHWLVGGVVIMVMSWLWFLVWFLGPSFENRRFRREADEEALAALIAREAESIRWLESMRFLEDISMASHAAESPEA